MQLAGDGFFGPPRDRDEALLVLRAAVESGVGHIDTAQYYGAGTVSELIREALHPYPDGLAIVSKLAGRQLRQWIEDNLTTLGVSRLAAVNLAHGGPGRGAGSAIRRRVGRADQCMGRSPHRRCEAQQRLQAATAARRGADRDCLRAEPVQPGRPGTADVLAGCGRRSIAFVPFCPLGLPGPARSQLLASPVLTALGEGLESGLLTP